MPVEPEVVCCRFIGSAGQLAQLHFLVMLFLSILSTSTPCNLSTDFGGSACRFPFQYQIDPRPDNAAAGDWRGFLIHVYRHTCYRRERWQVPLAFSQPVHFQHVVAGDGANCHSLHYCS
jgi:hypothetical protein